MRLKKFLKEFSLAILFGVLSLGYLISYFVNGVSYDLIKSIIRAIASIFFILLTIKLNTYHSYYIAYNKYYLNSIDIFDDAKVVKEKTIIRYKKYLKDKVINSKYKLMYNKSLNIYFKVYELKDNLKLIAIKNIDFMKSKLYFDDNDRSDNVDLFIEINGIKPFKGISYVKKYTSNDNKSIILIQKDKDLFKVFEYTYTINHANKINQVFKEMIPYWTIIDDSSYTDFDNYEDSKMFAVNRLNIINNIFTLNGEELKYFILPKQKVGTAYHEFQTGNKVDVHWDKTSIYLHDDIMVEHRIGEFLSRVIPNYDYFGKSLVNETTWNTILNQVTLENEIVKEIISELTLWAEESINEYGCFTILGL